MKPILFAFVLLFCLSSGTKGYSQGSDTPVKADSMKNFDSKKGHAISRGHYGLSVSGGISKVLDSDFPFKDVTDTTTTKPVMASAQIGFFYNIYIGKYSVISFEPGLSMVLGNARTIITAPGIRHIDELRKRLFFFCLPVSYGLNFRRFSFNIGMQASVLFFGQTQKNCVNISPFGTAPRGNSRYEKIDSNPFDMGATAKVSYCFYKRLSMFVHLYYGLTDVYRPKTSATNWSIQQLTLGVKCPLDKTNGNSN